MYRIITIVCIMSISLLVLYIITPVQYKHDKVVVLVEAGNVINLPENAEKSDEIKGSYSVQAGAFGVMENAEKLAEELSPYGDISVYYSNQDLFHVRFAALSTKKDAQNLLQKVKMAANHSDLIVVRVE